MVTTLNGPATLDLVVPAGVIGALLEGWGSRALNNGYDSKGAYISARVEDLIPGETLRLVAGGQNSTTVGGFNGGGDSANLDVVGYGGGGASDIRRGGITTAHRILVAGAAGGGINSGGSTGGNGGYPNGGTGSQGATGGTQSAGGTPSTGGAGAGEAGDTDGLGEGGDGKIGFGRPGGGGGGGYHGGGGGGGGFGVIMAGGGGSSYYHPSLTLITAESNITASWATHGKIQVTFDAPATFGNSVVGAFDVLGIPDLSIFQKQPRRRRRLLWVYGHDGIKRNAID